MLFSRPLDANGKKLLAGALGELSVECARLPLSDSLLYQIQRAQAAVSQDHPDLIPLLTLLREVRINIDQELAGWRFYAVPEKLARWMADDAEPFGSDVATRFPDATKDVLASGRCLALNEWTACVFHCMRVLEIGLHAFAAHLGVSMTTPIELENWKNVIDLIEKEIRKLEARPKSAEKSEKLRQYSDAASQFRYFKDAWRNHVSHARVPYDSREAETVWNHTRDFMQAMAEIMASI